MNIIRIKFYVDRFTDYFLFLVLLFGIIGNFLSYKIYARQALNKNSFAIYFKVISIVDLFIVFHSFTYLLDTVFYYNLLTKLELFCKTLDYTVYVLSPVSGYLLVIVSFDRFMKIKYPKRFSIFFQKKTPNRGHYVSIRF